MNRIEKLERIEENAKKLVTLVMSSDCPRNVQAMALNLRFDFLMIPNEGECPRPRSGWRCSLDPEHLGPCDPQPVGLFQRLSWTLFQRARAQGTE